MNRNEALNILGLNESASDDDIKKAYKKKAKTAHPDVGGSKEKFQKISDAYSILTKGEDEQPTLEDFMRRSGFGFSGFGNFQQAKQQHIPSFKLTLEEAFAGGVISRNIDTLKTCTTCNGTGRTGKVCSVCNGTGQKTIRNGNMMFSQPCQSCMGAGRADKCTTCNGTGSIKSTDDIKITIPKYTFNSGRARNELHNSIQMVNVVIDIQSKEYILHGNSLVYRPDVELTDAINGYTIKFVTEEFYIDPFTFDTKVFNNRLIYQPNIIVSNKEQFTEFVKTL